MSRCPRCGCGTIGTSTERSAICGCSKGTRAIDYENLKRVIIAGTAEAARDAGLTHFVVAVTVHPVVVDLPKEGMAVVPEIEIEIVELSPEQAAKLQRQEPN